MISHNKPYQIYNILTKKSRCPQGIAGIRTLLNFGTQEAFLIRKTVVDLYIKQEEIKERYKRKTGTDLVPERRKMAALRDMFDFQRFSGNEKLCSMIRRAEEHSGSRLSFDDLDLVNAAGTPDILQKKNRDMQ